MWAYQLVGPRAFRRVELSPPTGTELAAGQVVLRLLAGGICGSDLPFFRGRGLAQSTRPSEEAPGFPLHEVVGEVVASRAPDLAVGSRVVGWAESSRGLAEMVVADAEGLVPARSPLEAHFVVTAQPLACVLSAVDRLGDVRGRYVTVLGLGPIGVLFAHVLNKRGAIVSGVDLVDRSQEAGRFGLASYFHGSSSQWAKTHHRLGRPDVVVEAVGHQDGTFVDAVEGVAPGGTIYYFGIPSSATYPLDMTLFLRKQLNLAAGTTVRRRHYLRQALAYLDRHPNLAQSYVTTTLPFGQVQAAFEAAASPRAGQLKITLATGEV